MNRMLFGAALCVICGCNAAMAVTEIRGIELWQDADSARFVVLWTAAAPPGDRQAAFSHYEVQIIVPTASVPVALDTTSLLNDTLAVAYPPLGNTLLLMARVRSIDVDGRVSEWANSLHITLNPLPFLTPSPPGGVTIDTLLTVVGMHLRPSMVVIAAGVQIQFCTIVVLSNGTSGLAVNSPECQPVYDRWLTEVGV